jgi:glycosyltransferase involved in cell wall biosynthesis
MSVIRVIVISSVRPEPVSAGQIVLHRHLVGQAGLTIDVYGHEPGHLTPSALLRRLFGRLQRTPLHRVAEDFWAVWGGRWLDGALPHSTKRDGRTVVLTVAHGDVCLAALRFARKHQLPLVTFFHDWWPDIPPVHAPFHRRLNRDFVRLYQASTVALCVSAGMKTTLGRHPCAPVLYPIPKQPDRADVTIQPIIVASKPFQVLYSGNLFEYGPMLGEALKALNGSPGLRLEVRGANPNWPVNFREAMRAEGRWKDFAPREKLDAWLAGADAFLVPMVFDSKLRQRMETSFPSKLIEFAQLGKPLVIWGPEYCSAVQWAKQGNRALCVTEPDSARLRQALEALADSPAEYQRLATAARQAAATDFNPDAIQRQFMETLREITRGSGGGSK